jgi:Uma2 family endonuclease
MPRTAERLMDVDAFLDWASKLEGKFELHDGRPVAMSPERVRHAGTKSETYAALREAIRRANLPCRAYVDGITVRVRNNRAFIPDVLVASPAPPPDAVTIGNPVIVVEVLSPTTEEADHGIKLNGYFSLPSLAHYLILDPVLRVAIHHTRESHARGAPRHYHSGSLRLDPPGLDVAVEDLFEPEARA